jgi:hypothetical protein
MVFAVKQQSRVGGFGDLARQKGIPVAFLKSVGGFFGLFNAIGDNHNRVTPIH